MSREERHLRLTRTLLVCAGAAYLGWWLFVRVSLPSAFNPFPSRAAVVAWFFAVFAASYFCPAVARRLDAWLALSCCLATAHYFYLFDRNHADLNWMIGSYITVMAVCAILQSARSLLVYSLFVAAISTVAILRAPDLSYIVFLPGMWTMLLFANIGLRSRLRLLDQLQDSHEKIEAANQELESFSYSVAHDLRGPLRGINGFSRILLEDHAAQLDAEAKDYLERIGAGADKMGALIDALLALARVTRMDLQQERVDLTQQAETVIKQLQAAQPDRRVDFVNQAGVVAQGDPRLLRAVLDNLLGNAWKFTAAQAAPRVAFGCTLRNGMPVYFVQDNGAGFDMAFVSKLFAPFRRLHQTAEYPGTGIGLATVQRIVQRHGGRVWAEGKVDQGATFYFTLQSGRNSRIAPLPVG